MPQTVRAIFIAVDSCILYEHKEVDEIEKQLSKDFENICHWFLDNKLSIHFENICDWFVDNRLSIHFGENKTKSILFASKRRKKNVCQLKIRYNHINIKQHSQVTYIGCVLNKTMLGEPMAVKGYEQNK